jgi:hypothetical protein
MAVIDDDQLARLVRKITSVIKIRVENVSNSRVTPFVVNIPAHDENPEREITLTVQLIHDAGRKAETFLKMLGFPNVSAYKAGSYFAGISQLIYSRTDFQVGSVKLPLCGLLLPSKLGQYFVAGMTNSPAIIGAKKEMSAHELTALALNMFKLAKDKSSTSFRKTAETALAQISN